MNVTFFVKDIQNTNTGKGDYQGNKRNLAGVEKGNNENCTNIIKDSQRCQEYF